MNDEVHPVLQSTANDHAAAALRTLTSLVDLCVPGVGSLFGEIIGIVIPNLKSERLEIFLTRLARRLSQLETDIEDLSARLGPPQVDLFEQGARAAVSSASTDRIDQIVEIVAHGMTGGERSAASGRSFLLLLSQLTDGDIVRLSSFHHRYMGDDDWKSLHREVLDPTRDLFGKNEKGEPVWSAAAYAAAAEESIQTHRLLSFGLLRRSTRVETNNSKQIASGKDIGAKLVNGPLILSAPGEHLLRALHLI